MNTSEIKDIKNILDLQLRNNDINIVDIILSYLLDKCSFCDDKMFEEDLDVLEYGRVEDDCKEGCNDEKEPEKVCDTCKKEHSCYGCNEYLCGYCNTPVVCGSLECDRSFCEDCSYDLLSCCGCSRSFCCEKVYKINGHNETLYRCMGCIEEDVMYPVYD